jgi:hypothetical protein
MSATNRSSPPYTGFGGVLVERIGDRVSSTRSLTLLKSYAVAATGQQHSPGNPGDKPRSGERTIGRKDGLLLHIVGFR